MSNQDKLDKLTIRIREFTVQREWKQFHDPKNLALSLQLEAAEVLELFQWTKDNEIQEGKEHELADELSDVLYWLIKLADHYSIDLLDSLDKKMDKNEAKYPVEKAKGRSKKYSEL